jgi:ATP-dependent Clp protease ATP-binding subunit ClpA
VELLKHDIRVNAIVPAEVMTPLYKKWLETFDNPNEKKKAIEKTFSPEFRNRLDSIITFAGLPEEVVLMVVEKMLVELEVKLQQQKVIINVTDSAKSWLAKKGYDPIFGARPMARTIQREIETVLADEVLFGKLESGGEVSIGLKKDKLTFKYS